MNLRAAMNLTPTGVAADGQDWIEYRPGIQVIPTSHPPSLRNPKNTKAPLPSDGWHPGDSQKKKQQARKDMKTIIDRTLRQQGKPVMVRHAVQNTQQIYAPLIW